MSCGLLNSPTPDTTNEFDHSLQSGAAAERICGSMGRSAKVPKSAVGAVAKAPKGRNSAALPAAGADGAANASAASAAAPSGSANSNVSLQQEPSVDGLLTPYLDSKGDWSAVPPPVKAQIHKNHVSTMDELFGAGHGVGQLIELSLLWFAEDGGQGVDLPWYVDADPQSKRGSQPAIKPSRYNRDLQEQTLEEYKQRLMLEGQPQSVAGTRASV